MSDYRDPNDPMYRNTGYEPAERTTGTSWGWIAGAAFLVVVLALGFRRGTRAEPRRNDNASPPEMGVRGALSLARATPRPSQTPNQP